MSLLSLEIVFYRRTLHICIHMHIFTYLWWAPPQNLAFILETHILEWRLSHFGKELFVYIKINLIYQTNKMSIHKLLWIDFLKPVIGAQIGMLFSSGAIAINKMAGPLGLNGVPDPPTGSRCSGRPTWPSHFRLLSSAGSGVLLNQAVRKHLH